MLGEAVHRGNSTPFAVHCFLTIGLLPVGQLTIMCILDMIFFHFFQLFLSVDRNSWCRKHHDVIRCLDIRLKTVVLKNYCGIKSHVNFALFFVLNAKMLESMTFEGGACHNQKFIAEQHSLLELEKRVSRSAQFYFTVRRSQDKNFTHVKHVHDLSITDPFEYRC